MQKYWTAGGWTTMNLVGEFDPARPSSDWTRLTGFTSQSGKGPKIDIYKSESMGDLAVTLQAHGEMLSTIFVDPHDQDAFFFEFYPTLIGKLGNALAGMAG